MTILILFFSLYAALNNPIYELHSVVDGPMHSQTTDKRQITISMESSPLYSSQSVADATLRSQFTENQNLLGILRMPQRSRSQEPIAPLVNGGERMGFAEKSISRSAMNIAENKDPAGNVIVAVTIDPYGSYKESLSVPGATAEELDYGSMGFDDP